MEGEFLQRGRDEELMQKRGRLHDFLDEHGTDALLVSRHENIAWATAGQVDVRIGLPRETGAASLLFTRSGSYYLTTNNEAARLAAEEFGSLDFQPLIQPWYAADPASLARKVAGNGKIAADHPATGFPVISMTPLRLTLSEWEMERYRWLGKHVAETVTKLLSQLKPGMTEIAMQALVAEALLAQRILPSVLLIATDNRIRAFRHAVSRGGVLQRFCMLNLCARRWGLSISITRFAHFGAMPAELEEKFAAVARVNASLLHATQAGATSEELFLTAQQAYAAEGFPGEEKMHHQGSATGYWEREWIARPGGAEQVLEQEAFAWNPSLQGAKAEDTVVLRSGKLETLTRTPELPVIKASVNGRAYNSAGVLLI